MKDKRITRLLRLLEMLQSGDGKNATSLAKSCGVGRRTIFRDLQTLRDAGVALEFDPKAQQYFVPNRTTGLADQLTAEEAIALIALATEFGRHDGLPFFEAAETATAKLVRSLPSPLQKDVRRTAQAIKIRPTRPAQLNGKSGIYQQLLAAIEKRYVVEIVYTSLTEWESITTRVQPYQLLFSQHSWYVIGRSSLHREVRIFNLARVESIATLDKQFAAPRGFDLERHLGNAWHLIPDNGRDSQVVIRFKPLVARNVAEVKWHKTQRTEPEPDGSMIFRATVSGLNEIAWWILGYGDQAEVLEPPRLRTIIAQRAKNMAAIYNGDGAGKGTA